MSKIWWVMLPVLAVVLAVNVKEVRAVTPVMISKSPVTDELSFEEYIQSVGCRWCGLSCVRADVDINCVMLAPPEGKSCGLQNGECKVVDASSKPTVTPKQKKIIKEPTKKNIKDVSPVRCKNSWWIDDKSSECKQKEFCGLYMYKGLRIFDTKDQCQKALDEGKSCGKCGDKPRKRGDADCNEKVEIADFALWKTGYVGSKAKSSGTSKINDKGDFNCDSKVSLDDFWIWRGEFIKSKLLK